MDPQSLRNEVREEDRKEVEEAIPSSFRRMTESDREELKEVMTKSLRKRKKRLHRLASRRRR